MLSHYAPEVSVNVLPPRQKCHVTRARKRPLSSFLFTYADLKNIFSGGLAHDLGIKPSSFSNMLSALKAFMTERQFTDSSVIGSTLRGSFYKARDRHLGELGAQGQTTEYVSNRRWALGKWRAALVEADRRNAAARNEDSPFQSALKALLAERGNIKGTARNAGVPLATLRRWLGGAVPNGRSVVQVPRIEGLFGLAAGTLSDLLPRRSRLSLGQGAETGNPALPRIEYRERLKSYAGKPYALRDASESLRAEWRELVKFKTHFGQYRRWSEGKVLQRQKTGRWKKTGKFVRPEGAANWFAFHEGAYVPTAGITWSFVSQYLGWLCLAPLEGGLGLDADTAHTLGHLANGEYVERFVEWKITRSGGVVHGGITTFLTCVKSLCNPETGYLSQSWSVFGSRLGIVNEEVWRSLCKDAYDDARTKGNDFADVVGRSRHPFPPIQGILALQNPLEGVVDAIKRMEANRPSTGGTSEALWARDRLLVKLLASNPIRKTNLQLLTYHVDGTGHLRKEDGVWRIYIPKEEMKNQRGAAKDRDYQIPVRQEVWADIERYIAVYRPLLADPDSRFFFVRGDSRPGAWASLARQFAVITKRYFLGCPGVGPQAMRHIVATTILKVRPNDWTCAAWALHDKEETVRKSYAHLRSDDAKRWLDPAMAAPFARM
jgi:hypothetical protein